MGLGLGLGLGLRLGLGLGLVVGTCGPLATVERREAMEERVIRGDCRPRGW